MMLPMFATISLLYIGSAITAFLEITHVARFHFLGSVIGS